MRTFVELVERYINPEFCPYPEYKGKPYYSIKYIENGEEHVGYSSYSLQVISEFLKKYFISPALEQDRWIPVTERPPEENGHYLVTLFDEIDSWTEQLYWNTTFGGRWQGLIEDDFSDIGNVSAWRPLPEPYTEEEE